MKEKIKQLLQSGQTWQVKALLDEIRQSGDNSILEEWRLHELYGAVFHDLADAEGAAAAYFRASKCDTYLRSQREHFANYLFAIHYLPNIAPKDLAAQHFMVQKLYDDIQPLPRRASKANQPLKIGFLAVDFLQSSSARFYEALIEWLAKTEHLVYLYSLTPDKDEFTQKLQQNELIWRNIDCENLAAAAKIIYNDGIDILIDLTGQSAGGMTLMISAYQPATIQLSVIGWFDTTGVNFIDGILTDKYLDPDKATAAKLFSEKLLYLPQAFCFTPTNGMRQIIRQSSHNDETKPIIFGSLQNFMKLNDEVLACWKELLQVVPNSRLLLQDTTRLPERRKAMLAKLKQADLPLSRIDVRLGHDDYLADYNAIDIMLDTFPYPGGASTATALYMGVPVITLAGDHHSSRIGVSILEAASLPEFVAKDKTDYVLKAANLANNRARLISYQQSLRSKLIASPLMQPTEYVTAFLDSCQQLLTEKLSRGNIL